MKNQSAKSDSAQNEFRRFAWNLASSISKTSVAKSHGTTSASALRAGSAKRVRAK